MNNYIYNNYDWNRKMNSNMNYYPYMNNNSNNYQMDMFNPTEGFEKGNMFKGLYKQYKNYQPMKLIPKDEREKRLFEIQSICFAAHELNLFLDTHPDNQSMLALFNDYMRKEKELTKEYERMYGPLTVDSIDDNENIFKWVEEKWPWEGER